MTFPLEVGKECLVANKEIELDRPLTQNEFLSGRAFGSSFAPETPPTAPHKHRLKLKPFVPHMTNTLLSSAKSASKPPASVQPVAPMNNAPEIKVEDNTHWTVNWSASYHSSKSSSLHSPHRSQAKTPAEETSNLGRRRIRVAGRRKAHNDIRGWGIVRGLSRRLLALYLDVTGSMGSVPWKGGGTLSTGYRTMISGREVELDSQVEASQLPYTPKIPDSGNKSPDKVVASVPLDSPKEFADQVSKFVAPVSFYGATVPKKSKGPL